MTTTPVPLLETKGLKTFLLITLGPNPSFPFLRRQMIGPYRR